MRQLRPCPIARTVRPAHGGTALLNMATLLSVKTVEDYDFAFASGAPKAQIQELATFSFDFKRKSED